MVRSRKPRPYGCGNPAKVDPVHCVARFRSLFWGFAMPLLTRWAQIETVKPEKADAR